MQFKEVKSEKIEPEDLEFQKQYCDWIEKIRPSESLVSDTLRRMSKRRRSRMGHRIAVCAAALLLVFGGLSALAAQTDTVYEVLYALMPEAAQFLKPVNEVCEDQGIKMEVVSAAIHGDTADAYVTLQDTTGSLFGESAPDLLDSYSLNYPVRTGQTCGCTLISYDPDTHTAIYYLHITNMDNEAFRGGKYTFSIRELLLGRQSMDGILVDYDLSNTPMNPATEEHLPSGASFTPEQEQDDPQDGLMDENYAFLKPQGMLWQSEDGIFTLTAAGYAGDANQLHLLFSVRGASAYDNHGRLTFYAPDGSETDSDYTISYLDNETDIRYTEYVFDVPYNNLSACMMTSDLYTASGKIAGDWHVTFRLRQQK